MCACNCGRRNPALTVETGVLHMVKMVNYEGKIIPADAIPRGSLFIRGIWYGSLAALPSDMQPMYKAAFSAMTNSVEGNGNIPHKVASQKQQKRL